MWSVIGEDGLSGIEVWGTFFDKTRIMVNYLFYSADFVEFLACSFWNQIALMGLMGCLLKLDRCMLGLKF